MMRQSVMRKRLTGISASSLAILAVGCGVLQVRHAAAQEAVTAGPDTQQAPPAVSAAPAASPIYAKWSEDLAAWRAAREREIGAPDGWLTLVGMEWLKSGVNSIGAAQDNLVRVHAQAPDHIGIITVSGTAIAKAVKGDSG